ncbi:MAG TPA: zinc dependent phospholipase C family protein [Longimicrobiales bacterium]
MEVEDDMPQPGLHLLLARRTLERWRTRSTAPFDTEHGDAENAFLHGSLAPDMGNFPGGSRALARAVHTRRTGQVARALLRTAGTDAELAFAWGWVTHVIADALIHPLINDAAARRAPGAPVTIAEHVRVEVGVDVWFCWQHAALSGVRLRPAFDRTTYQFLARALNPVLDTPLTTAQLARMEKGLILFSHGALHFATSIARHIWWRDAVAEIPLASSALWHTASRLSPRDSVVNAYLTPHVPEPRLVRAVQSALVSYEDMMDGVVADDAESLPDYNLEDGRISGERAA